MASNMPTEGSVSIKTMVDLFCDPLDLHFMIGQSREDRLFSMSIVRVRNGGYQPVIFSKPFAETRSEIIAAMADILMRICERGHCEISTRDSFAEKHRPQKPNSSRHSDLQGCLNQEMVRGVLDALQTQPVVLSNDLLSES